MSPEHAMKLRAEVARVTGQTRHFHAELKDGSPAAAAEMEAPAWVEIVAADDAFYLLRYTRAGECLADTWHRTEVEAKAQATFEYGIEESEWKKESQT